MSAFSSSVSMLIGRFWQAFFKPSRIFRLSYGSRRLSFFIIEGSVSSIRSCVVKRFWHPRHSLLLRMVSPVPADPRVNDFILKVVAKRTFHQSSLSDVNFEIMIADSSKKLLVSSSGYPSPYTILLIPAFKSILRHMLQGRGCTEQHGALNADPMICCLNNCILFGMEPSTKLVPLSGRNRFFLTQATNLFAMDESGGRSIVPCGQNSFVFYQDRSKPASWCRLIVRKPVGQSP